MNRWIDMHCHLNFLEVSAEEAIEEAEAQGVERFITIGTSPDDHGEVLSLINKFPEKVFGTLGIHPHEAKVFDETVEKGILRHLSHPNIVAVGELGLDYYYDNSERDVQRDVFRRQLQLAIDADLPVEIHTRDAEEDTIQILEEFGGKVRGLLHCFSGSQWLADEALKLGLNISISGIVTFKKAQELQQIVKSLPVDRIHVETDAPYLAPVPQRGKKNRPAFVIHTAEFVANLLGIPLEQLESQTRQNALNLFPKLRW